MQARAFNKIFINYKKGFLTKTSTQFLKIKDEINYYLSLPKKISNLFPKLIDYKKDYSSYKLEYIPYKTISELLVNNELNLEENELVLKKILNILDEIHEVMPEKNNISQKDLINFYINKTLTRIDDLTLNKDFNFLLNLDYIFVNSKKYKTFKLLKSKYISAMKHYIDKYSTVTVIHGDFCFSNILYCPKTKNIKLIDPRGSFGYQGIYGDPYYDYAKIFHCVHGQYDHMVHDQYIFKHNDENSFIFEKPFSHLFSSLHQSCRKFFSERGINLEFIYLIEASLFLSMASLHYEDLCRQKALFLTGLIMLNDFFEGKHENLY